MTGGLYRQEKRRWPTKNLQEKEARRLGTCNKFSQLKYTTVKFLCSSTNTNPIVLMLCELICICAKLFLKDVEIYF